MWSGVSPALFSSFIPEHNLEHITLMEKEKDDVGWWQVDKERVRVVQTTKTPYFDELVKF